MGKIFGIFDTRIIIWVHYLILVGGLFLGFYIGETFFNLSKLSYLGMFIFWFVWVSFSDQLIHSKYILNTD